MSRPLDPHKPLLPFGNPFRMIFPKGSSLSPKLLDLLNTFELTLSEKLKKLNPADKSGVLCLSWMRNAMESLCEIQTDIKALIAALELPVRDWDEKWIDVYFDDSVKLLDISVAFSSELSRLKQGNLFLKCLLHNLSGLSSSSSSDQFTRAQSSMEGWRHHISSKNPKFENCFSVMDGFAQTLHLPKIKNSRKGEVLIRAMYGAKAVTLFVSTVLASTLSGSSHKPSGSSHKPMDLHVPETCLWADAFNDLQNLVNTEIRKLGTTSGKLKELEAVDVAVPKLHPLVQNGVDERVGDELLQESVSELEKAAENLCGGLDLLAKEVDRFFRIILSGRDALLGKLRIVDDVYAPNHARPVNKPKGEMVVR